MLTTEEQDAVTKWLKRNKVTKCPLGASGIYDSFGEPLRMSPRAYARIATRVRKALKGGPATIQDLARRLGVREIDVRTACARHKIEVVDAPPKTRRRKKS